MFGEPAVSKPILLVAILLLPAACKEASEPAATEVETPSPAPSPTDFVEITPEAPEHVSVPVVEGRRLRAARRALQNAGLAVNVARKPSDEPAGTVLRQRPPGAADVRPGRTVTLIVARPQPPPPPPPDNGNCTPGYSPCIPPGPDVDCAGGSGDGPRYVEGPVTVTGSDPYRLDEGGEPGIGCES